MKLDISFPDTRAACASARKPQSTILICCSSWQSLNVPVALCGHCARLPHPRLRDMEVNDALDRAERAAR